jgi:hypothetical protein
MPMSRHPIFGATMERLRHKHRSDRRTQIFDVAGYILVTEQSRDMVTQARLHTLTTVSTSFVMSIQSRPSVLSEIHMFCRARFPISFSLFLCLVFDCVEEGTSGGVDQGMMEHGWLDVEWHGIGAAARRAFRQASRTWHNTLAFNSGG